MADGVKIDIHVKTDGVYLRIERRDKEIGISLEDIMNAIKESPAGDINMEQVNAAINSADAVSEVKISENVKADQNADKIVVEISRDRMEAKIKFVAGAKLSADIPVDKIMKALEDAKVQYGIMNDVIAELAEKKHYDSLYTVAVGKAPVNGMDGYLDIKFDNSSKTYKPKIMANGKADYRELELVKTVDAGQLLVSSIPPVVGTDGINVLGQVVAAKLGKPAPALPHGKNVEANESKTELYATSSGQIIYDGKSKISISPVLELSGNVDNKTGNINFNGAVVIRGSVLSGFSVTADGNIEVMGVVEGAFLKSGSHIFLYSGVKGADKAVIQADGDITVKYAENCTMESGRNIIASCIIYSDTKCGGYIEVSGKNGSLVGGKTKARQRIEAVSIGSPMAAGTEIEVGIGPEVVEEYRESMKEFNHMKTEYLKIEKLVATLTDLNKKGMLEEQKKSMLLKSIQTKIFLRQKLDDMQKQIDELMPKLSVHNGSVMAREVMYSGVKLMIGNAVMYVRDDIKRCILKNADGKIVIDRI